MTPVVSCETTGFRYRPIVYLISGSAFKAHQFPSSVLKVEYFNLL